MAGLTHPWPLAMSLQVVEQLMLLLNSDAPAHAREFGAVLLRQQFRGYHGEQSVFSSLPRDTQERGPRARARSLSWRARSRTRTCSAIAQCALLACSQGPCGAGCPAGRHRQPSRQNLPHCGAAGCGCVQDCRVGCMARATPHGVGNGAPRRAARAVRGAGHFPPHHRVLRRRACSDAACSSACY